MEKKNCYIYTRVSTSAQVEGYSLDAQLESLRKYADYRDLEIKGEYCDAGVSGGSIIGRHAFQNMIADIVEQKDNIAFVLVFKLSRFGRNSADVLKYMQLLIDYDIDLISVNESIDSSTQSGKMMLTIMSAVAEIEKENIRCQFMAGKQQKIMNGGWRGGPVPYGYRTINKELVVEKSEAEIVSLIYNLYSKENASLRGVCDYLDRHGYQREYRGKMTHFNDRFIAAMLDNPIYCGKYIHNKRAKVNKEICYIDGIHEPIVSAELWDCVREKRKQCVKCEKVWDKDRVSLLTGVVKCPVCGDGMVHVVSRSVNKNHGGMYKPVHGYVCPNKGKHRYKVCSFSRSYNQEKVDAAVYELIGRIGTLSSFNKMLEKEFDNDELKRYQEELKDIRKQIYCKESEKSRIGIKLDNLDVLDGDYISKYEEFENEIDSIYDDLTELENLMDTITDKISRLEKGAMAEEHIRKILANFQNLFDKMDCYEKKEFYQNLIERIDVFPDKREDRRIIKSITFKFPIVYNNKGKKAVGKNDRFVYKLDCAKIGMTKAESHASYAMIKEYVMEKYGLKIHSLYIAQIKRKFGLIERQNYNISKKESQRVPTCPKDKEKCIVAALKHFKEIS